MKETVYRIQSVMFTRTEDAEPEPGLLINEGSGPILDAHLDPVPECWDYRTDSLLDLEVSHIFREPNPRRRKESPKAGPGKREADLLARRRAEDELRPPEVGTSV